MGFESREFHRGAAGNKWLLAREPKSGHIFVRHEAGAISHIELSVFLRPGNSGPEHLALRSLIGELIDAGPKK